MLNPFAVLRAGRKPANADGSMSLMEHLYELRRRLTIAALGLTVGAIVGFLWFNNNPFGIISLGEILTNPYCSLPSPPRADLSNAQGQNCELLATKVFEPFFLQLKVGVTAGVVLSSPIWLSQLWGFITPGLLHKERKFATIFVTAAVFLFVAGSVLAYLIISEGLKVLLGFSSQVVTVALSPNDYFGFLIALIIIFGVSFELPLLVVMLNQVGILSAANLRKWRRGIIMGLFVFAAFATPGGDPISMLALAVALVILFELAGLIAASHDKRLARAALTRDSVDYSELGDDEMSPLATGSSVQVDHAAQSHAGTDAGLVGGVGGHRYTDAT